MAPKQPYFVSEENLYAAGHSKILEIPITLSGKRLPLLPNRGYFYRWLRPTYMTTVEMRLLVEEFTRDYDNPILNRIFHSMEVIPGRSPYVRTRTHRKIYLRTLERTIEYILRKGFRSLTTWAIYHEKEQERSSRP